MDEDANIPEIKTTDGKIRRVEFDRPNPVERDKAKSEQTK
jgi:hypothetical protein